MSHNDSIREIKGKTCSTCAKRLACTDQRHRGGLGCRAWEGTSAELVADTKDLIDRLSAMEATLASKQAEIEKERELEVWRQAYNAALTGITADPERRYDPNEYAEHMADQALADYRQKREEMGL